MKKLSILAFAIVVAVGCGKKKEEPAATDKTTEMGKDNPKAATPETATNPGDDKKTDTPAAPPVGALEDLKALPTGMPKDCVDAEAAMKTLHDCDKVDMETRKSMSKAWNLAVTGSYENYARADEHDKQTIAGSCTSMLKTVPLLIKDCP